MIQIQISLSCVMHLVFNFDAGVNFLYDKLLPKMMVNKYDYVDSVVQRAMNTHQHLCWL